MAKKTTHWGALTHDIELSREYSPETVFWQMTPLAVKRLEDRELPPLPMKGYEVLQYLGSLEYAEEDELAVHLDITLPALRELLARLSGFGYVQRVELRPASLETPTSPEETK